ncbi:hypothetical protein Hamer_G025775 [Homarus americanus]|uniref:Uncharacterized protein n=1 Tax=Homarus americanus TaxID=6706 RepID=A0A8J5TDT1_HOMAM|nr:hypothetical protein Hamer_G025775 [Homarus americanus]
MGVASGCCQQVVLFAMEPNIQAIMVGKLTFQDTIKKHQPPNKIHNEMKKRRLPTNTAVFIEHLSHLRHLAWRTSQRQRELRRPITYEADTRDCQALEGQQKSRVIPQDAVELEFADIWSKTKMKDNLSGKELRLFFVPGRLREFPLLQFHGRRLHSADSVLSLSSSLNPHEQHPTIKSSAEKVGGRNPYRGRRSHHPR